MDTPMPVNLASPWSGLSLTFHFMCFLVSSEENVCFFWKIHTGCTDFVLILGVCNFFLKIHTGCSDFVAHVNARDTGRSLVSFYLWRGHAGTPSNLSYTLVVDNLLWEDNVDVCIMRSLSRSLISYFSYTLVRIMLDKTLVVHDQCLFTSLYMLLLLTSFYLSKACKL